jgi:hypothetical protein
VSQFIAKGIFSAATKCPYLVAARSLIRAIMLGPEVMRAGRENQKTRIDELKKALRHIDRAIGTLARDRRDMKALSDQDPVFQYWADVINAEQSITNAVHCFIEEYEKLKPDRVSFRGRKGMLALQGIAQNMVLAWEELTGTLPGKNNTHFHDFLHASATTVFGPLESEPDWEWVTRSARDRIKGWKLASKISN